MRAWGLDLYDIELSGILGIERDASLPSEKKQASLPGSWFISPGDQMNPKSGVIYSSLLIGPLGSKTFGDGAAERERDSRLYY